MSRRNKAAPKGGVTTTDNKTGITTLEGVSVGDAFSNPLFRLGYGSQSPLEATEYPLTRMTDNLSLIHISEHTRP